ncbi:MAG: glutamate--tRNA ligase, partial [Actinomycetia bacterium]|nr:glutamate--tRNA ligase [Actinomycetes bacterium]
LDFALVADDELQVSDEARAQLTDRAGEILAATRAALAEVTPFEAPQIEQALREALVAGMGLKPRVAFTPPRVAISGKKVSPPLFESMELLGRDSVLARIDRLARSC